MEQEDTNSKKPFHKAVLLFLAFSAVTLSPFATIGLVGCCTPAQFGETYLGGLSDKYNRLLSIKSKKIILIVGSAMAFGMRSDLLQESFPDYDVVNFGLYGTIGTKAMMDLSKANIGQDDIVLLAPEMSAQSFSLYFNPDTMLECLDSNWSMYPYLAEDNRKQVIGHYFSFFKDKMSFMNNGGISLSGVYQRENLNNYGDIAYYERDLDGNVVYKDGQPVSLRLYNKMSALYDPNALISFTSENVSGDFIDYANNFAGYVREKGAIPLFDFSPANLAAVTTSFAEELDFYNYCRSSFSFSTIGNPFDYLMDPGYFYDSNYHTNDAGAIYRTGKLVLDLRRYFQDPTPLSFDIPGVPVEPSPIDPDNPDGPATQDYFTYSDLLDYKGNKQGLLVAGVSPSHLVDTELSLPLSVGDYKVLGVDKNAFSETTNLQKVNLSKYTTTLKDGCFSGCSILTAIHMDENLNPSDMPVSVTGGLLSGCNENVKIEVPSSKFDNYWSDYFWSYYKDYLVKY